MVSSQKILLRGVLDGHIESGGNGCAFEKDGGGRKSYFVFASIEGIQCVTSIYGALTAVPAGKATFTFLP